MSRLKGLLSGLLTRLRLNKVIKYVTDPGKLLDVGCDDAYLLGLLLKKNNPCLYVGVDNHQECINDCEEKFSDIGKEWAYFFVIDANEDLPFNNNNYDYVVLSAIIEHLNNFDNLLKELTRVTKDNSRIIITTPTRIADTVLKIGASIGLFANDSLEEHVKYYSKKDFINLKGWELKKYQKFELGMNQLIILEKK